MFSCFCKQLFIFIANIIFQNVAQILYGANARAKITEVSHRFTVLHTDKLISRHIQFSMYADRLQSYTVDSIYTVQCTLYSTRLCYRMSLFFFTYSQPGPSYFICIVFTELPATPQTTMWRGQGAEIEPGTGGSIGGTLPTT